MAILGCARCHAVAPSWDTKFRDAKGRPLGQWWMWPGDDDERDVLMVCPDCILALLEADLGRSVRDDGEQ